MSLNDRDCGNDIIVQANVIVLKYYDTLIAGEIQWQFISVRV